MSRDSVRFRSERSDYGRLHVLTIELEDRMVQDANATPHGRMALGVLNDERALPYLRVEALATVLKVHHLAEERRKKQEPPPRASADVSGEDIRQAQARFDERVRQFEEQVRRQQQARARFYGFDWAGGHDWTAGGAYTEQTRRQNEELRRRLFGDAGAAWREVLGVSAAATWDEVRTAYRKLRGKAHPDRGGDAEQFRRIQQAYEQAERELAPAG